MMFCMTIVQYYSQETDTDKIFLSYSDFTSFAYINFCALSSMQFYHIGRYTRSPPQSTFSTAASQDESCVLSFRTTVPFLSQHLSLIPGNQLSISVIILRMLSLESQRRHDFWIFCLFIFCCSCTISSSPELLLYLCQTHVGRFMWVLWVF